VTLDTFRETARAGSRLGDAVTAEGASWTFDEMIQLGDELLARGRRAFNEVPAALAARGRRLTNADKILGAFLLKMLSTFDALVDDARCGRGESMHHLKTLCESYIYLIEMRSSDQRARLVLARAYDGQRRYLEAKGNDTAENRELARLTKLKIDELTSGQPLGRETVEDVARRHPNLPSWYDVVYRLACQPAHISDLEEFFPTDEGVFPEAAGAAWSVDAIRRGLEIMLWLTSFVNQTNEIGIAIEVEDLARRFRGNAS
jgi:hypothetical protein